MESRSLIWRILGETAQTSEQTRDILSSNAGTTKLRTEIESSLAVIVKRTDYDLTVAGSKVCRVIGEVGLSQTGGTWEIPFGLDARVARVGKELFAIGPTKFPREAWQLFSKDRLERPRLVYRHGILFLPEA